MTSHAAEPVQLDVRIQQQPDDSTCGPTCLHAVYDHFGDDVTLGEVIRTAPSLPGDDAGRGTLAVMLGLHALRRGYDATLYTFNLQVFDPTWFREGQPADPDHVVERLLAQAGAKCTDPKLRAATPAYVEFLREGGEIRLRDLSSRLIVHFIRAGRPILTGLSATYLYRCAREFGPNDDYDDIRGVPAGHFVVLHGYDPRTRMVTVADPLADNPAFAAHSYQVSMARLVPAIMLGVLTYDANLLVIEPLEDGAR